jgi:DNA-binding response OmpR family regulator
MAAVPRVLVVEDEHVIRSLLVAALRREIFEVDAASDGAGALQLTAVHEYAVILLDLMMPRVNGFEFIEGFVRTSPNARSAIIVLTAFDDVMVSRLPADRVHAIFRKPFDLPALVSIVREVAMNWAASTASTVTATAAVAQAGTALNAGTVNDEPVVVPLPMPPPPEVTH